MKSLVDKFAKCSLSKNNSPHKEEFQMFYISSDFIIALATLTLFIFLIFG